MPLPSPISTTNRLFPRLPIRLFVFLFVYSLTHDDKKCPRSMTERGLCGGRKSVTGGITCQLWVPGSAPHSLHSRSPRAPSTAHRAGAAGSSPHRCSLPPSTLTRSPAPPATATRSCSPLLLG